MLLNRNIAGSLDAYKYSHPFVMRKDVESATSYLEARSGWTDEVVFFGLQAFIREYLTKRLTVEEVLREKEEGCIGTDPIQ